MVKNFKSLSWFVKNFEEVLLVISLCSMVLLVFWQTLSRFTTGSTPSWTQELAQFIQVYFVYLGASYAIKKNAHMRLTFLINKFPKKINHILEINSDLFFIVFCALLLWFGTIIAVRIYQFNQVSASMRIPMFIPYLAVPLGGGLMIIRLVQNILNCILLGRNEKKGGVAIKI